MGNALLDSAPAGKARDAQEIPAADFARRSGGARICPQTPEAVFTRYCVTCHNPTAKVAGLVINPAELGNVAANPELWEKVVRKLRSAAMPPVHAPRPDPATYESVATFLETELDRAAAASQIPANCRCSTV